MDTFNLQDLDPNRPFTSTENAIMVAATAVGTTVISNAASEQHVQGLCNRFNQMSTKINNIGTNTLVI